MRQHRHNIATVNAQIAADYGVSITDKQALQVHDDISQGMKLADYYELSEQYFIHGKHAKLFSALRTKRYVNVALWCAIIGVLQFFLLPSYGINLPLMTMAKIVVCILAMNAIRSYIIKRWFSSTHLL